MLTSTGKLIFDPRLQFGGKPNVKPFWLMLDCDEEIARYYKYLLFKERCILLNESCLWGSHISVIRGECPKTGSWGIQADEEIEFTYDGVVCGNGTYYWMNVQCPRLSEIRQYYGLSPEPYYGFHLTIGNNICN
jgi:hypothetical protein